LGLWLLGALLAYWVLAKILTAARHRLTREALKLLAAKEEVYEHLRSWKDTLQGRLEASEADNRGLRARVSELEGQLAGHQGAVVSLAKQANVSSNPLRS
jgi:cell division septum initiation protein DivIVA